MMDSRASHELHDLIVDHCALLLQAAQAQVAAGRATPFVLFDLDRVRHNARLFRVPIDGVAVRVASAVKSCYVGAVQAALTSDVDHFDVQSAQEAALCPADATLSFHGPILRLPERSVAWVSFNSAHQWKTFDFASQTARRYGARLHADDVALAKFGLDEPAMVEFLRHCARDPFIHTHVHRRMHDVALAVDFAARLGETIARLAAKAGRTVRTVNLGGGYDGGLEMRRAGHTIAEIVRAQVDALRKGLPTVSEVVVEPGRALFEDAAIAVTRVEEVIERTAGRVLVVDVASNLLSPLPGARYRTLPLTPCRDAKTWIPTAVVDGTCRARGVISDTHLPSTLGRGDVLAVANVGAYTFSFASAFFAPLPTILGLSDGHVDLIADASGGCGYASR